MIPILNCIKVYMVPTLTCIKVHGFYLKLYQATYLKLYQGTWFLPKVVSRLPWFLP